VTDEKYTFKAAVRAIGVSEKSLRDWIFRHLCFALPAFDIVDPYKISLCVQEDCKVEKLPRLPWRMKKRKRNHNGTTGTTCFFVVASFRGGSNSYFCGFD